MHPPRILVLVTIIGALVAGCSPAPVETPAPVPSVPTCTPEFGGTPYPCTEADYEANQRSLARYAEAERVYREYVALSAQEHVEGLREPSPELLALTSDEYGRALTELRALALDRATFEGEMSTVWIRPTEHQSGRPGNLSMLACADYSTWHVAFKNGEPSPTGRTVERVEFDDAAGRTVLVDLLPEEGQSC